MNIRELLKHSIYGCGGSNGTYSFERVLNCGILLKMSENPKISMFENILVSEVKGHDAFWVNKGIDFLIPLICLYTALLHRIGLDTSSETYPKIEFHPGLSEIVTGLSEHEYRRLVDDMELIYKLQVRITQDFYYRQVALLPEERCEELRREIESIEF